MPEAVPLSYWPAWVGQHVGPVALLSPSAVGTQHHFPNGIVFANLIVVQHSHCNLHFLWNTHRESVFQNLCICVFLKKDICGEVRILPGSHNFFCFKDTNFNLRFGIGFRL